MKHKTVNIFSKQPISNTCRYYQKQIENRIKVTFKVPLSENIWPIIWIKVYGLECPIRVRYIKFIQNLY